MPRDVASAEKEFRKAAEQGDPIAQFYLGHAHYLQARITGDFEEALRWIRRAAAQGYNIALTHLGYMYQLGEGVPLDPAESKSWFRKAAEQGDPFDECQYATKCWNGDFDIQDTKEAEIWWQKAATQGDPDAHHVLGDIYGGDSCFYGVRSPVKLDFVESFKWYTLAALQEKPGHLPKASRSARDRVAEDMTAQEITEAEHRVEAWLRDHPKAMGEEMVKVWRERVPDPLSAEEIAEITEKGAEAREQVRAYMKSIGKGEDSS